MDGNKRTALMGLNFVLLKNGYPEIYFERKDQPKLINSLEKAISTRDITDLANLIAAKVNERQEEAKKEIVEFRINNFMQTNGK